MVVVVGRKIRKYFVNTKYSYKIETEHPIQGLSSALKSALIKTVVHELLVSTQNFTVSGTLLAQ